MGLGDARRAIVGVAAPCSAPGGFSFTHKAPAAH
jgi:hypothetical protein